MVSALLRKLNTSITGLHQAALLLGIFALGSHVLALVRDRIFAHSFGAGEVLDLYYAAFRVPDFIYATLASMVSLFVLIPFITSFGEDRQAMRRFLSTVLSVFLTTVMVVSGVIFFFVPDLMTLLFPGFTNEAHITLITLTRIMLLSPIILGVSNIFASITQSFKKFYVYAVAPLLYNLGIIVGVLFLYPHYGVVGLAYGVVLGAVLHVLVQVPAVWSEGLMPRLISPARWNMTEIRAVVGTSLPRTIALSVNQIALLVLFGIASTLGEGSIAVFTFANNLQSVPLTVIGVSYSVAAFPTLAEAFASGKHDVFFNNMVAAIKHIFFWSFPAMILFIVLRAQIVRTILGTGAFSWADTRLTAAVTALFVISLVAHALHLLFVRGYYAAGKTREPLIVNTISALLVVVFGYVGVWLFETSASVALFFESALRITDVTGTVVVMLGLAYALGMIINAVIFWIIFDRDFNHALPKALYRTALQSFGASLIGGMVTYGFLQVFANVFDLETLLGIFSQGLFAGIFGIVAMIVMLKLFKSRELDEVWQSAHSKFWQRRPVAADIEEL